MFVKAIFSLFFSLLLTSPALASDAKKLSNEMVKTLLVQVKHEKEAEYHYLALKYYFSQKNLMGISKWFEKRAQEEFGHANKILDYIVENRGEVLFYDVMAPAVDSTRILAIFQQSLKLEEIQTQRLHALYQRAIDLNDYPASVFLQEFVKEQVEEEDLFSKTVEKLQLVGDSGTGLFLFDQEIAKGQ